MSYKRSIPYYALRADQLAAHQMYGQSGGATEPQIEQNMHSRNYFTRLVLKDLKTNLICILDHILELMCVDLLYFVQTVVLLEKVIFD